MARRAPGRTEVPYYHVVFTMPAEIADIAYHNKAKVYAILFKAAAETLITIAADPKHLGARIGFTSVLHTWGSALTHHPHVHCIACQEASQRLGALCKRPSARGGGISFDGERWVSCRPGFFLPVRVLSRLFRRLFLDKLAEAHAACGSSAIMRHWPTAKPSPTTAAACARSIGSSTPRGPSLIPARCSPISPATPTASPSPTLGSLPSTTNA